MILSKHAHSLTTNLIHYLQLPLWALVTLGAYLLSRVGWALLTFNDVPEAAESLKLEIEQARKELREKGVDVD